MRNNPSPAAVEPAPEQGGLWGGWTRFWFAPVSPLGLHWVRVLSGLLFLSWLLPLAGERYALFSPNGWVDVQAVREMSSLPEPERPPPVGWSVFFLEYWLAGSSRAVFDALWWGALAVLVAFTLGLATRLTAPLTWVVIVSCLANPAASDDTGFLLAVLAFYLAVGYLLLGQEQALTPAERLLGPRGTSLIAAWRRRGEPGQEPSVGPNVSLRLLQVHFAVIVVTSTLHQLQHAPWWSGVAWWYPLLPPFEMDLPKLREAQASRDVTWFFLSLAQYVALAWKLAFPFFAFRRRWRPLLLAGGALAWLGTVLIWGVPTFGPFFFVCCLSYLTAAEWQWLTERLSGLVGPAAGRAEAPKTAIQKPRTQAGAAVR